ncbi:hypothetical protein M9H77_25581 [Catharanthus roseus]|uniref:Uncharacterized protein n=1 Tax=Catharanthus roseus TaxID=4058 RepID=A0ACC0A798_CATRO|nr:hypothetical protein M9H77_25581 [Catharanthus roseus]
MGLHLDLQALTLNLRERLRDRPPPMTWTVLTLRLDQLERGAVVPWMVWPNWYYVRHHIMLCGRTVALWRVRRDLKLRCLAGIDYEMPKLVSDDLVMGSGLCPWSPTIALHVLLNSGVEAALVCLDSLRLPNCVRTSHVGGAGGRDDDEGVGLDDVPRIDDEEGVEMCGGLEYGSCGNGVKVAGGVDVVAGEADVPKVWKPMPE